MSCHPEAKKIRFSGFPRDYLLDQRLLDPDEPFLVKPFHSGEFVDYVRRILGWMPGERSG